MVRRANSVLVTGRIYTVESARSAIDFARRFDALIDPWDSDGAFDAIASMQRVGGYSVSLGEARDRSDLWIVIGDDRVLEQTPRLPEAMRCGRAVPVLLLGRWRFPDGVYRDEYRTVAENSQSNDPARVGVLRQSNWKMDS
jgi:hypothetical protein